MDNQLLTDQLKQLAPKVDGEASRSTFAARRRQSRTRRRATRSAAATVATCCLAAGIAVKSRSENQVLVTGEVDSTDQVVDASDASNTAVSDSVAEGPIHEISAVPFEVLSTSGFEGEVGTLATTDNTAEFSDWWSELGFGSPLPLVDFNRSVVVGIRVPNSGCPSELSGFTAEEGPHLRLVPIFVKPSACRALQVDQLQFIVALDRASVASGFTLVLPESPTFGYDEQQLFVDLSDEPPLPATPIGPSGSAPESTPSATTTLDADVLSGLVGVAPELLNPQLTPDGALALLTESANEIVIVDPDLVRIDRRIVLPEPMKPYLEIQSTGVAVVQALSDSSNDLLAFDITQPEAVLLARFVHSGPEASSPSPLVAGTELLQFVPEGYLVAPSGSASRKVFSVEPGVVAVDGTDILWHVDADREPINLGSCFKQFECFSAAAGSSSGSGSLAAWRRHPSDSERMVQVLIRLLPDGTTKEIPLWASTVDGAGDGWPDTLVTAARTFVLQHTVDGVYFVHEFS